MTAPDAGRVGGAAAWLVAIRPRTLPAAVVPVVVGTALAQTHGAAVPLPAAAALVGALLIQVGTNLANDYFDFRKGSDTEERIGPTRVVQAGLLSPRAVLAGTALALGAAVLVGAYLVQVGGWPILVIGLLSIGCALAYTGGPYPLAYHGLGDLFVFVFFGLVAVGGTYWVQALAFDPAVLTAGAGVGALSTAILVANNLRDRETDARARKRTLAVRLGVKGTRAWYLLLVGVAAAVPPAGVVLHAWSGWTFASLGALALLVRPVERVLTFHDPRELGPALGETARSLTWYGGLLAIGLVLGGPGSPLG